MLTPPGMGGKYRITGDQYPRMRRPRRRRRMALALIGSAAVLGLVGWGTSQLIDVFTGGDKVRAASGKGDCKPGPTSSASSKAPSTSGSQTLAKPAEITVNVYNATPRSGLAKSTAEELKKRGFKIGKVGNATARYDKKVKGPGMLLGAPNALGNQLRVLGTQLAGATVEADQRDGKDVDLIIGSSFAKLSAAQDADQALAALANPSPTPSATGPC
jgi:hypothetical protein